MMFMSRRIHSKQRILMKKKDIYWIWRKKTISNVEVIGIFTTHFILTSVLYTCFLCWWVTSMACNICESIKVDVKSSAVYFTVWRYFLLDLFEKKGNCLFEIRSKWTNLQRNRCNRFWRRTFVWDFPDIFFTFTISHLP